MAEANKDLFVGIFAEAFEQRQNKFSEVFIGLLLTRCIENTRQTLNEGRHLISFNAVDLKFMVSSFVCILNLIFIDPKITDGEVKGTHSSNICGQHA